MAIVEYKKAFLITLTFFVLQFVNNLSGRHLMTKLWHGELRNEAKYATYNFEIGEAISIVTVPLFYIVFYLRVPFLLAYLKYPSAAKYFIYLMLLQHAIFSTFPRNFGQENARMTTEGFYVIVESLMFSTSFLSALVIQQLTLIWLYFVAHPMLYKDTSYVSDLYTARFALTMMICNLIVLLIYYSILFIINELIVENRNKSEEYQQLLNWIKSGLILQQENEDGGFNIKFSNSMALKIFNKLFLQQKEVTEDDTNLKIFEKVTFDD